MFTAMVFFGAGYGAAYAINRFGPALKVWKAKREAEIEKSLRDQ